MILKMKRHPYGTPFVFATKIGGYTMCGGRAGTLCADQVTPRDAIRDRYRNNLVEKLSDRMIPFSNYP